MKKILVVILLAAVVSACQKKQYADSGPEIDVAKKIHEAYFKGDWDGMKAMYADTAKIYANNWGDEVQSPEEFINGLKAGAANYSVINVPKDPIYEVVYLADGKNYVHSWWEWSGTHKNGKTVKSVIHSSLLVSDGKVRWEGVIYNALPFYLAQPPMDSTTMK